MSEKLLTRDEFREAVFARDGGKCVVCGEKAQDAHHIMERRLFDNGGYFLSNGASLCGACHLQAEMTLLDTDTIRKTAGISKRILPEHLYEDYEYDKWGNIQNSNGARVKGELFYDASVQKILEAGGVLTRFSPYVKYARTYHLPFSLGRTDDDKTLKDCSIFENKEVVITAKMDGENTTGYWDGYTHARSLDSRNHESRNWVKAFLAQRLHDLPENWRICGENLYAKHSIAYDNLKSYFYLFSIWNENNNCLSWEETETWANLLDIPTVDVIYSGVWNEKVAREIWQEKYKGCEMEGFVVRLASEFPYANFRKSVAKFVRANHVTSSNHWIKTAIRPNLLKEREPAI